MIRTFDYVVKLFVWVVATFIITGYFNPQGFYCGHSISWRYFFTLCSVISIVEGMVVVVFISLAINANLRRTTTYLALILLLLVALEWMRGGEIIKIIASYSWKILGIIIGFNLSKDWINWKSYSVVLFFFLFAAAYWREEIDTDIIKLFLLLTSFIIVAFLINRIRKSKVC